MDPEQTFLRVHARLSGMLAQLLSPRLRGLLEHLCLVVAILLLALLAVMHVNFVSQAGCAKELSRDKLADAELLQIKMVGHGLWSHKPFDDFTEDAENSKISASVQTPNELALAREAFLQWFGVNSWRSKGGKRHVISNKENDIANDNHNVASEESKLTTGEREATLPQIWDRWTLYGATWLAKVGDAARRFAKFWRDAGREFLFSNSKDGSHAFSQKATGDTSVSSYEKGSDAFEPAYLYSIERGYLLLPEDAKAQHNVRTANISISARNSCFGNRWQQLLINSLVGYDTILMNSLLDARGEGYLYNYQTKEFYDLNFPREARGTPSSFQGYIISKCGVLIMSLFVFFTTTMSVSFTLRETQARMLKFTVQLQYHARHRLPTFRLIFVHVIESLVFVPIMIGILFFLFEFYEDQLLAFMVLTLVWLCELFTMISVRTPVSMQYFPKYFFLYFMVFHIYFFSYEYGFSYLAFSTTAAFMQHLVLYFWNHFEVPALQRFLRVRMLLQQQHGVQITSSAIITSMLQVTSLTPPGASPATGFDNRVLSPRQHGRPIGGEQNGAGGLSQVLPGGVVDRMYVENLNGVSRNAPRSNNSLPDANAPFIRNPTSGDNIIRNSERETGGVNAGLQQGFPTAAANNALGQPNPMSSFGSILLWILGGPSENLSAFFPLLRDSNGENVSSSFNENTTARRPSPQAEEGTQNLRREEGIQNLRWRGRTTETQ